MLLGTTIEESSDPGEGFAGQQPRDPLHVVFTRSDSLICLRRVHSDVLVEGDSLMARAVRRSNIDPVIASFPVKCKAPDGASVFEATSFFVNGAPAMRPHDPYGINSFGGFLSTTVNYVAGCSLLSGVEAFADNVSVLSSLSFTLTTRFGHALHGPCAPFADAAAARGDDAAAVRLPHRHGSRGLREVQRPGAGGQGGLLCLPLEPQTLRSRGVRGREAHDARTSDRVLRR